MRNVVLPAEVVEQLRNFLGQLTRGEYYSHATDEFANQQAEPFVAALDAALAAPDPWEWRRTDILIQSDYGECLSVIPEDDGVSVFRTDIDGDGVETLSLSRADAHAVALAIIELIDKSHHERWREVVS